MTMYMTLHHPDQTSTVIGYQHIASFSFDLQEVHMISQSDKHTHIPLEDWKNMDIRIEQETHE